MMKSKTKIKNLLPALTLLPLPFIILTNSRENFLAANSLSNSVMLSSTLTLLILYLVNLTYRATYSKKNQIKLIPPLGFIFTFQVIHQFVLLLAILGVVEKLRIQISSALSIQYFASTIIIMVTTFYFEETAYQKHEDNIKEILNSSCKEVSQSNVVIHATMVLLVVLLASKNSEIFISNIFTLAFLFWNTVFLQVIRPSLFNYLKDE